MSAETFVFTQLQSGALPTELSEATSPTCLHYLTLINGRGRFGHPSETDEQEVNKGGSGWRNHHGWSSKQGRKIGIFAAVASVAVKRGKRRLANGGVKGWDLQALREQRRVDRRRMTPPLRT